MLKVIFPGKLSHKLPDSHSMATLPRSPAILVLPHPSGVRLNTMAMHTPRLSLECSDHLLESRAGPCPPDSGSCRSRKIQTLIDGVDLVDATDVALRLVEADHLQEQVRVAGRDLFPDRGVPRSSVVGRQPR